MKRLGIVLAALTMLLAISSCSSDGYTDPSMRTLRYATGSFSGGNFVNCIQPGQKIVTNDTLYPYPVTQREDVWDTDNYHQGSFSADHPDMKVQVKGVDMYVNMKVVFFLNTSCKPVTVDGHYYPGGTLQAFHERIGKTRHAYFNENGTYGGEQSGWIWAMNNYISLPAKELTAQALNQYNPEDAWQNTADWSKIAQQVQSQLQQTVNNSMETNLEFYKGFQVTIYQITPEKQYVQFFKQRQNAQVEAQTADANKAARIAQAQADAAVAAQQAKILQAQIAGAGGPQWYWCGQSLEKGLPCFQPNGGLMITPKK